ncbi:glycosyltransferase family 25 protein [Sporormia fimetaria CBS 119925]|uniref:Glycosyltransferase family 25 protein n=1 Tax=Sporormia fimetaria CBS 119925 TaxID=1340428 RepID=A0A6A6VJ25_9PLEO|nr:glycosyltransferase family 25 protein [Sporormia fimetaria CBS 119925]
MPSLSHGRMCLVLVVCTALLFCLRLQHRTESSILKFGRQNSNTNYEDIGNQTLGFQEIFVINAPWRTDRKDGMTLAASYSSLSLTWINGVSVDSIDEKAYPLGNHRDLPPGNRGSWRAHMNALREIVERNLTTALILEDDADWDIRLRSQLSTLSPAIRHISAIASPSLNNPTQQPLGPSHLDNNDQQVLAHRSTIPLHSLPSLTIPSTNPYGLTWDILWLGHCGATLPPPSPLHPNRIAMTPDPTVPAPHHLKPGRNAPLDPLASLYPPHTRLIHRAGSSTLCTIAYSVTQSGARKLLYEFGVRGLEKGYDFGLSDYCGGATKGQKDGKSTVPVCVVVQPTVFGHLFGERMKSDISAVGAAGKMEKGSRYVRASVRGNLERLGRGVGVRDQWPD